MAGNSNLLKMTWRDAAGRFATCGILVAAAVIDPSGGIAATVRAAIAAVSAAYSASSSLSFYAQYTDTAAAGSFGDNEDKAAMRFADADGNIHTFKIQAPLESIFQADKETVDPANEAVMTYVAAMLASATTKAGRALVNFRGGSRRRLDRKGR